MATYLYILIGKHTIKRSKVVTCVVYSVLYAIGHCVYYRHFPPPSTLVSRIVLFMTHYFYRKLHKTNVFNLFFFPFIFLGERS